MKTQQIKHKEKLNPLYESYLNLKKENPKIKEREAAKQIGITEAELVASKVGIDAVMLESNFQEMLQTIHKMGEVLAITRNEDVVHERKGVYNNVSFPEPRAHGIGLVVNPDIDLRLFMNSWEFAFAVNENERRSIQFFDVYGGAVHKIYLTENSNKSEYYNLIEKFAAPAQTSSISIKPRPDKKPALADSEIDIQNLRKEWEELKDTHDFYMLLRKYKVERKQAFRLIGADLAHRVDIKSLRQILQSAKDKKCEIMVFVGNSGCLQIHTGPVDKLAEYGKWYNVLDPQFNLHVNEEALESAWVVKKPSVDGTITSLEFFDASGELLLTFFGKRKPGIPELELWRQIVAEIKPV